MKKIKDRPRGWYLRAQKKELRHSRLRSVVLQERPELNGDMLAPLKKMLPNGNLIENLELVLPRFAESKKSPESSAILNVHVIGGAKLVPYSFRWKFA